MVSRRLALKGIGQIEGVRKVHWGGAEVGAKKREIRVLIGVLKEEM